MTGPLIEAQGVGVRFPHYDSYGRSFKGRLLAGPGGTAAGDRSATGHSESLRGVDLAIHEGDRLALLGTNASGKSTLIRVLAGFLVPDRGRVERRARSVAAMDTGIALDPYATAWDTIRLHAVLHGQSWRQSRRFAARVIEFGEVPDGADQPIRLLPPGVKNRLGIAMVLLAGAGVMLFDDVFETVDPAFSRRVADHVASALPATTAIVLVSRQRWLLEAICTTAILLDRGTVAAAGPLADIAGGPAAGLLS